MPFDDPRAMVPESVSSQQRDVSPLAHQNTLSFLIPTHNRAPKLLRLLRNLDEEIARSGLKGQIDVTVSNNASTDATREVLLSYRPHNYKLLSFHQPQNLGLDGNMRFLYETATSEYVWFFSDDDLLLPGAIGSVHDALTSTTPDLLLFNLQQPPGSQSKTFNFSERVRIVTDPTQLIELSATYPKLSIYVLKHVPLSVSDHRHLEPFMGFGYWFIALCYSVFQRSAQPILCVLSEHLATCDDDYRRIRFDPITWAKWWEIFTHPYAVRNLPNRAASARRESYYTYVSFLWATAVGELVTEQPAKYRQAVRELRSHWPWLVAKPRSLIHVLLLKTNLAGRLRSYIKRQRRDRPI